jgi:hypothetical protein
MAAPIIRADGFVAPCIPTLAVKPPAGPDWVRSNRSPRKRNRSLDGPAPKFRILKIHRAETAAEIRGLRCETSDIPRQRPGPSPLTLGNVDTPPSTGNGRRETIVAGWAYRIRTWKCRNQNPAGSHGYQRSFRKCAEIRPLPQEVSSHLRMRGHGSRVSTAHQTQPEFCLWTRFTLGLARLATAMHMGWLGRAPSR